MSQQQKSHSNQTFPTTYNIPAEYLSFKEDELDIIGYLQQFYDAWKTIFFITFLAASFSVAVAFSIDRVYKATVEISLPTESTVAALNERGIQPYNRISLLKEYFEKVRSEKLFSEFIINHNYLPRLFPNDYGKISDDRLTSSLLEDLTIEILEPKAPRNEFIDSPTLFSISLQHNNEAVMIETLNEYLDFANEELFKSINTEQAQIKAHKLESIERQMNSLRKDAKNRRELQIAKLESINEEQISKLEQEKSLLVVKAKADRETRIAIIEEENQKQIKTLEQQKELLVVQAAENREIQINKAIEARTFALTLGIIYPTKIDDLLPNSEGTMKVEGKTEISLSDNQTLPLYLMGTKYLDTLIKTLEEREDDTQFLSDLTTINIQLEKLRNDTSLEILKSRESDSPFLSQINAIEEKISSIKEDKVLEALKLRTDDDPFIAGLPDLTFQYDTLEVKPLQFEGLNGQVFKKPAKETNKPIRPNKKLIVFIGSTIGFLLALIFVIVNNSVAARKTKANT